MNNYTISEIEKAQKKMSGYIGLLSFRYMNLCVKAEIASLLPVTVFVNGQETNIEEILALNPQVVLMNDMAQSEEQVKQLEANGVKVVISKAEDIEALVKHTVETLGDIYALVNMCPGPKPGPFEAFDDAAWTGAFDLCLLSYVRTIRAVLPSMKRLGGGRILNSTSSSVKDCLDNLILSNTMRMGVVGMSKTLAREVGKDNILVNVFGPGRIGTARIESLNKMRADKAGISVAEYEKQDLKEFPMGRYGTVDEYGRLAAWLCSEANTYVSGQTILLDGAMTRAY